MIEMRSNQYAPDVVSPPGETLEETIEVLGMSQAELAERMGRPQKTINEIVNGKAAITPDTALQLERVLGVPAHFWLNREQHYQEWRARQAEEDRLRGEVAWLGALPVAEMVQHGWIEAFGDPIEQMRELLRYFGVASPAQWQEVWMNPRVAFRHSLAHTSDPGALAAWLRKGELEAQQLTCAAYDAVRFKEMLHAARELTMEPLATSLPAVRDLCAAAGVAVVVVPALARSRASGATQWLSPTKAMLLLSLRYRTDDQFWFSFYHEAGHILLHGKRSAFIDDGIDDGGAADNLRTSDDTKEAEANRFAAGTLLPQAAYRRFVRQNPRFSKERICAFAAEQGIAPGVVVGRLQHDGHLPYTHCNDLKQAVGLE